MRQIVDDEPIVEDGYGPTGERGREAFKIVVKKFKKIDHRVLLEH